MGNMKLIFINFSEFVKNLKNKRLVTDSKPQIFYNAVNYLQKLILPSL